MHDIQMIVNIVRNMEIELASIKAKLNGEDFIRQPKKNPKLKAVITNNMFFIMVVFELLYLACVGIFEILFWNNDKNGPTIIYWVSVILGIIFQVSSKSNLINNLKYW
jgi:hypothetical protein